MFWIWPHENRYRLINHGDNICHLRVVRIFAQTRLRLVTAQSAAHCECVWWHYMHFWILWGAFIGRAPHASAFVLNIWRVFVRLVIYNVNRTLIKLRCAPRIRSCVRTTHAVNVLTPGGVITFYKSSVWCVVRRSCSWVTRCISWQCVCVCVGGAVKLYLTWSMVSRAREYTKERLAAGGLNENLRLAAKFY